MFDSCGIFRILALTAVALMSGVSQGGGICDPTLGLKDTAQGYRQRGDRCEGLYATAVSAATLTVASFTRGRPELDIATRNEVPIAWPAGEDGPVTLRARSLKPDFYYQMDTVSSPPASSYRWPTDVLRGLGVEGRDLGILASRMDRIGGVERRVFLPLRVGEGGQTSGSYRLVLVAQARLREVYLSLARIGPSGELIEQVMKRKPLNYWIYPRGQGVPIEFPALPAPGIYYGEIVGEQDGGLATALPFWFVHPGDA